MKVSYLRGWVGSSCLAAGMHMRSLQMGGEVEWACGMGVNVYNSGIKMEYSRDGTVDILYPGLDRIKI